MGRSAAGEIALLPTAFPAASWLCGERPGTATATFQFGADAETAELTVGDNGRLLKVRVDRWGNPAGRPSGATRGHSGARHDRTAAPDGDLDPGATGRAALLAGRGAGQA